MARLGMVLHHGVEGGSALASRARLAEFRGYDSLWVTERYFQEEMFSLLGFLAAATQRVELGVGVVNPYTRHPGLTAMAAATADRLSAGRLLLGLGRSDPGVIEGTFGIPYDRPRETLGEAVGVIRNLLAGETVDDPDGRFGLRGARLAVTPLRPPPIYLAAIGPRALRLAGAVADGVLLNAYVPAAYIRRAVTEVRAGAEEAGREPDDVEIACMLVVRLTDDPASMAAAAAGAARRHHGRAARRRVDGGVGRARPRGPRRAARGGRRRGPRGGRTAHQRRRRRGVHARRRRGPHP